MVKRIIRYLKGTKNYKVGFRSSKLDIIGFSVVDFAGELNERKSTSGHVFLFKGEKISWSNKKQTCVARYTMESKFIACNVATMYVVWIKHFIRDLKLCLANGAINVFCDNNSIIFIIKNKVNNSKAKHIDVNYH